MSISMSPFSRPSTPDSDYPPSPRSILEEYFMDIEDLQDIDALSITSSVSSSISTTSQKVFKSVWSGWQTHVAFMRISSLIRCRSIVPEEKVVAAVGAGS